jgi:streptogramin lyase
MTSAEVRTVAARPVFTAPGQMVNGLEATADGLWLCDQVGHRSYLVEYDGRVVTSFPSPARNASGISVGAGSVWVASNIQPSMVFRHDPHTGHCTAFLMLNGEGGVHGLQWRPNAADLSSSGTLWVARPGGQRVEHIDAATSAIISSIPFPLPRAHGLFWDDRDGTLVVVETNGGRVFQFDPDSGAVTEEWRIEGAEVHGLTRGPDGRIWIGDASTNQVLVVEP